MKKQLIKNIMADIGTVAIAFILSLIILMFIRPTFVHGQSMENTLHDGDYMIISKQAYRIASPERGDIVIIQSSLDDEKSDKGKLIIKRIIGLPGDKIEIVDGMLYLNDEPYQEDYIKDGITPVADIPAERESVVVPEGHYFALGDNRCNSTDSRSEEVGFVAIDDIKGKVFVRLFPFSDIDTF